MDQSKGGEIVDYIHQGYSLKESRIKAGVSHHELYDRYTPVCKLFSDLVRRERRAHLAYIVEKWVSMGYPTIKMLCVALKIGKNEANEAVCKYLARPKENMVLQSKINNDGKVR